jgi:hypothetical protein
MLSATDGCQNHVLLQPPPPARNVILFHDRGKQSVATQLLTSVSRNLLTHTSNKNWPSMSIFGLQIDSPSRQLSVKTLMYLGLIGPSGGYYVVFHTAPFDCCTGVDDSEKDH